MARKTVAVDDVKDLVNRFLAVNDSLLFMSDDDDLTPEQAWRKGVAAVLESVLFTTDNYSGFKYLGVERDEETDEVTWPDDTARSYY